MGIVVVGAIFVDIKGYPNANFIPGGRNAGRIEQVHGGVCRNVAEDIANVELRPTFVSLVDNTGTGADVIQKLKKHKVNTDFIKTTDNGMGTWLAIFDNSGDVVSAISKRPDLTPVLDILGQHGDAIFRDADSIVVEFDMDKEILKRVFYYAEKYNLKVYGVISNMSIAIERRDFLQKIDCVVCNQQEAGILFFEDYTGFSPEDMALVLKEKVRSAAISKIVVTMGDRGAAYAEADGTYGTVPAQKVHVIDTTGAGDAFFSGVTIGLTYGKTLRESCEIGTRLAASVICCMENVCPRFLPSEFDLETPLM